MEIQNRPPSPTALPSHGKRVEAGSGQSLLRAIRILSDGRPGHENQSAGLAAALARRTGATVETIRLAEARLKWALRFPQAAARGETGVPPQLLIATGHRTHLPVTFAARRFRAKSVIIMRPTWTMRLFDLCLIPSHDLPHRDTAENLVVTRGALNRIPEEVPPKQPRGVVLIGGPSKHYDWSAAPLVEAIGAVVAAQPDLTWLIADSFRTPRDFLDQLAARKIPAEIMPHTRTAPGWLPGQLLGAEEVWVTEDSVSMLHEAVTAQARTGVLPMPARSPDGRLARAVRGLVTDGFATPFTSWQENGRILPPARHLHETARCAEIVLQRLFAQHFKA